MRRYPKINLSWRTVIIAISLYALFLTGFSSGAHSTVSYTHLDVYKRQYW